MFNKTSEPNVAKCIFTKLGTVVMCDLSVFVDNVFYYYLILKKIDFCWNVYDYCFKNT